MLSVVISNSHVYTDTNEAPTRHRSELEWQLIVSCQAHSLVSKICNSISCCWCMGSSTNKSLHIMKAHCKILHNADAEGSHAGRRYGIRERAMNDMNWRWPAVKWSFTLCTLHTHQPASQCQLNISIFFWLNVDVHSFGCCCCCPLTHKVNADYWNFEMFYSFQVSVVG